MPDLAFSSLRAAHLGGVDGEFRRGRVSAILGPSGAGKTTLLSVLAGRVPRTGGAITLDGEPADLRELRQLLGFATEEDALLPLAILCAFVVVVAPMLERAVFVSLVVVALVLVRHSDV